MTDTAAVIGTALLPQVTKIVGKFTDLLDANKGNIASFADKLPAIFDKAFGIIERLPGARSPAPSS